LTSLARSALLQPIQTTHLELILEPPRHWLALIRGSEAYESETGLSLADGLPDYMKGASQEWLRRLETATEADPWTFGFAILHHVERKVIGFAGFKGPPDAQRVVELGYGIAPAYQGRGYATEAAQALVAFAVNSGRVSLVRAHTLPKPSASTSVLKKCGFNCVGEVHDPEDGPVWRWERSVVTAARQ